jgi:Flp pilus assembly pilin Flp
MDAGTARAGEAGATAVEYAVLVGVLVLGMMGGVTALRSGIEDGYDNRSTAIAQDPGYVSYPGGSGGPSDPIYEEVPPPEPEIPDPEDPEVPEPEDPEPEDPEPEEPDPPAEPEPVQASFGSPSTSTTGSGQNARWSATVPVTVNRPDSTVTVTFSPGTTGEGVTSVSCVLVNGSCSLENVGPWEGRRGQGQSGVEQVVFTVSAVDGEPVNGPSLTVLQP